MAPPLEPVSVRILNAIKVLIESINGGSTYFFSDIKKVEVAKNSQYQAYVFPTVLIHSSEEYFEDSPLMKYSSVMTVNLIGFLEKYEDIYMEGRHLAHDIIKVMNSDSQLGGLCIDARLDSIEYHDIVEASEPSLLVLCTYKVQYRTPRNDPTST